MGILITNISIILIKDRNSAQGTKSILVDFLQFFLILEFKINEANVGSLLYVWALQRLEIVLISLFPKVLDDSEVKIQIVKKIKPLND